MPFLRFYLLPCSVFAGYCIHAQAFSVTGFGAKGDGKTVNTQAFQKAIDACNKGGGGEVIVSKGIYIIGTVYLKSNINLVVQKEAIIRGSNWLQDYERYIPAKPFTPIHKGILYADKAEKISITGGGIIDRNSNAFFFMNIAKK